MPDLQAFREAVANNEVRILAQEEIERLHKNAHIIEFLDMVECPVCHSLREKKQLKIGSMMSCTTCKWVGNVCS